MTYLDVRWLHQDTTEPTRLVSELNPERIEVRKLEFFRDGVVHFAMAGHSSGNTRLGEAIVPTLPEINSDTQFRGSEISALEFEQLWAAHVHVA